MGPTGLGSHPESIEGEWETISKPPMQGVFTMTRDHHVFRVRRKCWFEKKGSARQATLRTSFCAASRHAKEAENESHDSHESHPSYPNAKSDLPSHPTEIPEER